MRIRFSLLRKLAGSHFTAPLFPMPHSIELLLERNQKQYSHRKRLRAKASCNLHSWVSYV